MKQLLPLALLAILCVFAEQSNATIRRVGYFGTLTATDYTDFQSAHDAANAGDTIYLYPGSWSGALSTKLIIMGYGYFLSGNGSNAGQQVVTSTTSLNIGLAPGSDNAVFDGVDNLQINANSMNDGTSTGVIIKHCRLTYAYLFSCSIANWQITQCYLDGAQVYLPPNSQTNNLKISNCIFSGSYLYSPDGTGSTGQLTNCSFDMSFSDFHNFNFLVKNCIFVDYGYASLNGASSSIFQNNIFNSQNSDTTGTPASNKNVDFSVKPVFNTGLSKDNNYSLASGSPAKGAGASGVDCGPFGGPAPYILSGLPAVPAVTKLTAPSTSATANPYTITLSIQSH